MKTYTFTFDSKTFATEAATYGEALDSLVFAVGSAEAARYTFVSAE